MFVVDIDTEITNLRETNLYTAEVETKTRYPTKLMIIKEKKEEINGVYL